VIEIDIFFGQIYFLIHNLRDKEEVRNKQGIDSQLHKLGPSMI